MNKPLSFLLLGLSFAATAGYALADGLVQASNPTGQVIQVAAVNTPAPEMTHEVASIMQTLQKAQAQYRRSGNAQDLARVQAMRRELASRGFGRMTTPAPAVLAQDEMVMPSAQSVRVSSAAQ